MNIQTKVVGVRSNIAPTNFGDACHAFSLCELGPAPRISSVHALGAHETVHFSGVLIIFLLVLKTFCGNK